MIRTSTVAKVTLVLGLVATSSFLGQASAQAASLTFTTQFFNPTGQQVGSGSFTIDPDTVVTRLLTDAPAMGAPDLRPRISYTNTVTNFQGTVGVFATSPFIPPESLARRVYSFNTTGFELVNPQTGQPEPGSFFIDAQTSSLRGIERDDPRALFSNYSVIDRWAITASGGDLDFFQLAGGQTGTDEYAGTWFGYNTRLGVPGAQDGWAGTWRAVVIPEPSTMAGIVTAVGFGAWLQRKKRAQGT